jgi:ABC-type sugar transport system ATPase subunit
MVCRLGQNGAGKSTLMKILTGVHPEFEGEILLDGQPVRFKNTKEEFAQGISIVFQEFNLCPNFSAMENLFLGNEVRSRYGLLSYAQMRKGASAA